MTQYGYVSMRNQDGTQWARVSHGILQWETSKRRASRISKEVFDIMEATQEQTRRYDCPDNGFYGVYNLHFQPLENKP